MHMQDPSTATALHWVGAACRWLILAALAAQLVFAHGCHGDEDHELFGVIGRIIDR